MINKAINHGGHRYKMLEQLIKRIIEIVGDDPLRNGLKETPRRVAKMLLDELLSGYKYNPKDFLKVFEYEDEDYFETYADVVIVKDIPVRSICEHHLLPFFGYAHIAYIPTNRILGLSKFSRIVDVFSRRLQIQERLTNQIADFIMDYVGAKGSLVIIEAIHTCTFIRGVKEELKLITRASRGVFNLNEHLRSEVMSIIMNYRKSPFNIW